MRARIFAANPIARAERMYQIRFAPRRRRWLRVLVWVVLAAAFTLAFILAGGELAGAVFYRDPDRISRVFGPLNTLPLAVAVLFHFALMFRTLALSANSITREQQANNWDMLVLTGIDARRIVWGKWWATVRRMWFGYVLLAILRAAVIIWVGAAVSRVLAAGYPYTSGYLPPDVIRPTLARFLLAAGIVFAFTMVNLPFTAACGVTAFNRRSGVALARAFVTRTLLLVSLAFALIALSWWMLARRTRENDDLWFILDSIVNHTANTLIENGVHVSSMWVTYRSVYDLEYLSNLPLAILTAFGLYLMLTFLLLRFAQWQVVRYNALPPLSSKRRNLLE